MEAKGRREQIWNGLFVEREMITIDLEVKEIFWVWTQWAKYMLGNQ